jgi:hypothetical protein
MPIQNATSSNKVSLFQGNSHSILVTVSQQLSGATPPLTTPMDVTGATSVLTVKKRGADSTILLQKSGTVISGPAGQIQVDLVPADTASLPPLPYVYDVQVTLLGGKVYTVVRDYFEVKENVNH